MKGYHTEKCFGMEVDVENGIKLGWDGRIIVLGKMCGFPPELSGILFAMFIFMVIMLIVLLISLI